MVKTVLRQFGLAEERIQFKFISASEGRQFAQTVQEMVAALKKLGPNPLARPAFEEVTHEEGYPRYK